MFIFFNNQPVVHLSMALNINNVDVTITWHRYSKQVTWQVTKNTPQTITDHSNVDFDSLLHYMKYGANARGSCS